jgi:hypothetical protein
MRKSEQSRGTTKLLLRVCHDSLSLIPPSDPDSMLAQEASALYCCPRLRQGLHLVFFLQYYVPRPFRASNPPLLQDPTIAALSLNSRTSFHMLVCSASNRVPLLGMAQSQGSRTET